MAAYYVNNYAGMGEMLRCGWMKAAMYSRAGHVMAVAQAIAPVGDPNSGWYGPTVWTQAGGQTHFRVPGEYASSFSLSSGVKATGASARAYGRVTNTSGHALAVEYGFAKTPRYRTLGRALGAAGGDVHAAL